MVTFSQVIIRERQGVRVTGLIVFIKIGTDKHGKFPYNYKNATIPQYSRI